MPHLPFKPATKGTVLGWRRELDAVEQTHDSREEFHRQQPRGGAAAGQRRQQQQPL